jgi:hypothetical protein
MNTKNSLPGTNGRKRPQLTDSISRLDSILDGLADAIPETVASSIRESLSVDIKEAVQTALSEAFTSPEVLAALAARLPLVQPEPAPLPTEPTPGSAKPSLLRTWLAALRAGWTQALTWTGEKVHNARSWCGRQLTQLRGWITFAWNLRSPISIGLGAGVLTALLSYMAGTLPAAILSGLLATVVTTAGVLLVPLVRMLARTGRT